eukprot:scaffold123735_cov47-Prasinocladus_malaysianus.AAC.2
MSIAVAMFCTKCKYTNAFDPPLPEHGAGAGVRAEERPQELHAAGAQHQADSSRRPGRDHCSFAVWQFVLMMPNVATHHIYHGMENWAERMVCKNFINKKPRKLFEQNCSSKAGNAVLRKAS